MGMNSCHCHNDCELSLPGIDIDRKQNCWNGSGKASQHYKSSALQLMQHKLRIMSTLMWMPGTPYLSDIMGASAAAACSCYPDACISDARHDGKLGAIQDRKVGPVGSI
eukprot:5735232-Amphidinium_carterae.1